MITLRGFNLFPPFPDMSTVLMCLQSKKPFFTRHDVPPVFREPFIFTGYRSPCSTVLDCLLSIFYRTNETLNFWTHIFPTLYFVALTISTWQQHDLSASAYGCPLAVCLITVCVYPFMSAVAHVFNTMSERARHMCFFLDYAALSMYSLGVAVAYKTYVFPTELIGTRLYDWYLPIATINALGCMLFSCQTRFMRQGALRKLMRFMAFAIPYIFDSVPLLYRIFYSVDGWDASIPYHVRQFYLATLGALLYTSHLPERWFPGTFDILGHSHQLFHLSTAFATRDQVLALTVDLEERRDYLLSLSNHSIPSSMSSVLLISGALVVNLSILAAYTIWMYSTRSLSESHVTDSAALNGGPAGHRHRHSERNNNTNRKYESRGLAENGVSRPLAEDCDSKSEKLNNSRKRKI